MNTKLIALGTLLFTLCGVFSGNHTLLAQNYLHGHETQCDHEVCPSQCNPCQTPCDYPCTNCPPVCEPCAPCPPCDPCDPCAPVCGTSCGISCCAIGIGIAAVAAAAAIIIASGDGDSGHAH
ncbi:MAG: hypothetical protein KDK55_00130 [Chlamydiia bacterium]|nr:hypothetical protein [Chlamydiia bacterium]